MFVKICGLQEKAHVDAAVAAGADAVGFVFAKSVREISPDLAAEIAADVPAHVKRVAVMLHPSNEELQLVLGMFGPDVLQTDVEDFASLDVPAGVERWPVFRQGKKGPVTFSDAEKVTGPFSAFVYEGGTSGVGETVNWSVASEVAKSGNMILAGGLDPSNVALAIESASPYGVDVSSGVELAPGQKDPGRIIEFINAAKAAGNNL